MYEGMFIFSDSLKDNVLEEAVSKAKSELEQLGGAVRNTTKLGRRRFARSMQKREQGHYYLITFDLDPLKIDALHARYRLNDDVFRVQLVRVEEKKQEAAPAPAEAAANGE